MKPNPHLAITIPTYNRADFLNYSLEIHVALVKTYNIAIYISDNASSDCTKYVVQKWQQEYPLIYYFCNEHNIGEINFEIALKLPKTKYVWLLGDTYKIPPNGIDYILKTILDNKIYDVIVVNLANEITHVTQHNYQNPNVLLHDIGALMTCLSCLIYHETLIKNGNFKRYYNTFFIQTGVILEYIANHTATIHWAQSISMESLIHPLLQKSNWSLTPQALEIGCEKWVNFIFSLPPVYSIDNKLKCLKDFGKISKLFTLKGLFLLRLQGILNFTTFKKYHHLFKLTIEISLILIFILSITPKFLLHILKRLSTFLKKRKATLVEL